MARTLVLRHRQHNSSPSVRRRILLVASGAAESLGAERFAAAAAGVVPGASVLPFKTIAPLDAHAVNRAASDLNAWLIVVPLGAHHRFERIFGHDAVVDVMRHARIPVVAVPPTVDALPERALAAMDFTAASMSASAFAAALLAPEGTLVLGHVCAFPESDSKPGDLVDVYRAGARAKLAEAAGRLARRARRAIETKLLEGEPGAALVRYATDEHCDLIALGGHEQGLVDRILLGSVRTEVLRHAPCAVLIAPPAPRGLSTW